MWRYHIGFPDWVKHSFLWTTPMLPLTIRIPPPVNGIERMQYLIVLSSKLLCSKFIDLISLSITCCDHRYISEPFLCQLRIIGTLACYSGMEKCYVIRCA